MTPDRYESEFHLPAGHAASFAGGPLAALRNPNPEMTKYETAIHGLYLTGCRNVSRCRCLGVPAAATVRRSPSRTRREVGENGSGPRATGNRNECSTVIANMSNGSLHLGRYFSIPVRAHWSMAFIAVLFGVNLASALGIVAGIIAVLAFFVSILAHEFGHALVARRYAVETESIDLWALGGVARLDREPPTPRADGFIAVAGPLVSLTLGVFALGTGLLLSSNVVAG